jgi:hypothetical protein
MKIRPSEMRNFLRDYTEQRKKNLLSVDVKQKGKFSHN